jgi:hypothetical protein
MVQFGSAVPLWVAVPPLSIPVFIGTRAEDPFGYRFYRYWAGTTLSELTPIVGTDPDAAALAAETKERLLPFAPLDALERHVPAVQARLLPYGLPRREHVRLTVDDPDSRWWLYAPIAEVHRFIVNGEPASVTIRSGQLFSQEGVAITVPDRDFRAHLVISAYEVEVHYAIDWASPVVRDALPYFLAAAYLRSVAERESGLYDTLRVGAVTFSFRSVKDWAARAAQLERTGWRMLASVGLL